MHQILHKNVHIISANSHLQEKEVCSNGPSTSQLFYHASTIFTYLGYSKTFMLDLGHFWALGQIRYSIVANSLRKAQILHQKIAVSWDVFVVASLSFFQFYSTPKVFFSQTNWSRRRRLVSSKKRFRMSKIFQVKCKMASNFRGINFFCLEQLNSKLSEAGLGVVYPILEWVF